MYGLSGTGLPILLLMCIQKSATTPAQSAARVQYINQDHWAPFPYSSS